MISDIEFSTALHLGSGRDKHELYKLLTDDGEIIALDPDRTSLERNSSSFKIQGDGAQLPFEDDTLDIVFSEYVFEHLPEPADALAEINRVCRPNGSIGILVPNPLHYYAIVADNTPFWFHDMWLKFGGNTTTDIDTFPTQYQWGNAFRHSSICR